MIAFDGVVGLALLGLWVFCILDCIATDSMLIRNLPKGLWLVLVIILPDIGSIAWLILGRPQGAGFGGSGKKYVPPVERQPFQRRQMGVPPKGPDDDPHYLRKMEQQRLQQWEDELRRREEDLRRKEGGSTE